jgi:NOL1/NOP2/sun family putative RNA methylase
MEKTNFLDKFSSITGLSKSDALRMLNVQHNSVLVLNTLKNNKPTIEEIAQDEWLKPCTEYTSVYEITGDKRSFTHIEAFAHGYYYVQNLSSLLPVLALNVQPGDTILDMCAAPGGKSFNICRLTNNNIRLVVNEPEKHRLEDLKTIINVYGLNVSQVLSNPGQGLYRKFENMFDKILLDAPCSAEGLITQITDENPKYWSQKKVKNLRNLQKKLINSAYKMLAAEGTLVYSTCTYSPEENEDVIDWLLNTYSDIALQKITDFKFQTNFVPALTKWNNKLFDSSLSKAIRVLPNEQYEGFFIAKIKKI